MNDPKTPAPSKPVEQPIQTPRPEEPFQAPINPIKREDDFIKKGA